MARKPEKKSWERCQLAEKVEQSSGPTDGEDAPGRRRPLETSRAKAEEKQVWCV